MGNFNSYGSDVRYITNNKDFSFKFYYEPRNCYSERKYIDVEYDNICITDYDLIINGGNLTLDGMDIKETINDLQNTILELKERIEILESNV